MLFPGQGVDPIDALLAWQPHSAHCVRLLEVAAEDTGVPRGKLTSRIVMARTDVCQPVMVALCLGIVRELGERGVRPDIVAGHSLGELAAWAAAGGISDVDAVRIASIRGRLMLREATKHPGAMVAVRSPDEESLARLVAEARREGTIVIAAHNTQEEWVLAGDTAALRVIQSRLYARPLSVGGAWHSPAMAGAADEYRDALRRVPRSPSCAPLVSNCTARVVQDDAHIIDLLVSQLTQPVRWFESMATLASFGVTTAIICGPGKTLGQMARLDSPPFAVRVLESPADLAPAIDLTSAQS